MNFSAIPGRTGQSPFWRRFCKKIWKDHQASVTGRESIILSIACLVCKWSDRLIGNRKLLQNILDTKIIAQIA